MKIHALFIAAVSLFSVASQARWADLSEATSATNFYNVHYQVHKNGSFKMTLEKQMEILKDKDRQELGMTRLNFDGRSSRVKVIEAYTLNGTKKSEVVAKHIEVKPLASSGPGFDVIQQLTIAYPDVSVGSKLYLKYEYDMLNAPVENFFSFIEAEGWKENLQKFKAVLDSEMPLYTKTFDPEKFLKLTNEKSGTGSHIEVELLKPLMRTVVDEENIAPDLKSLAWFAVSSIADWSALPSGPAKAYERAIHSRLPLKFEKILETAQALKDDFAQINAVTSALAENIRYVGDWVPVKGAFYPRPLAVIDQTGFGDCKDFTVSTASILSRLGFETHAAWINRGREIVGTPFDTETLDFNHAIVYATKNGREFWIDPTNMTSYAQGMYPDIADRRALVLFPDKPVVKRTPAMTAEQSLLDIGLKLQVQNENVLDGKGELKLSGRAGLFLTGAALSSSKQQMDFNIINWLTNIGKMLSWKFGDYDLTSRIVKDVDMNLSFQEKWNPFQTSAGTGYLIPAAGHWNFFQFRREERVSGLFISDPGIWRRHVDFKGKFRFSRDSAGCQGQSPWIDFRREIKKIPGGARFEEEIVVKKVMIPIEDIRSEAFAKTHEQILSCLQQSALIFD